MNLFITSMFSILFLFLFWNILWKRYSLDKLREELFTLRNELFDLVIINKEFSYNDKIYMDFEKILNGTVQYAHNINVFQYLIFNLLWEKKYNLVKIESKFEKDFNIYIVKSNNVELKSKLLTLKTRYTNEIIKYIIKSSFIMMLYISSISFFFFIKEFTKLLVNGLKNFNPFQNTKNDIKQSFSKTINDIEYKAELCNV
ncbi:MAG: hypothetical protein KAT05_03290 [Spirochaetes bacterium]|nr:hypothetical protein [Spirochaetota bacterium]